MGPRYGRRIECDMLGVADSLRRIDPDYSLWLNYESGAFEVHAEGQHGGSLCLVLPYDRLDERSVRLVRRTRAERADKLFAEIERDNERLMKAEAERAERNAALDMERRLSAV